MVRPKVDQFWKDRVFEAKAENEERGAPSIEAHLEEIGAREGRDDWPSRRTITRWLREWRALKEEERRPYRLVSWPETFQRPDLPWEAVPVFFDLLRWNHGFSPPRPYPIGVSAASPELLESENKDRERRQELLELGVRTRPSVRLVRWLHRVTSAAPDSPFDWRLHMASRLAAAEGTELSEETEKSNRDIEARIATELYYDLAPMWAPGPEEGGQ